MVDLVVQIQSSLSILVERLAEPKLVSNQLPSLCASSLGLTNSKCKGESSYSSIHIIFCFLQSTLAKANMQYNVIMQYSAGRRALVNRDKKMLRFIFAKCMKCYLGQPRYIFFLIFFLVRSLFM